VCHNRTPSGSTTQHPPPTPPTPTHHLEVPVLDHGHLALKLVHQPLRLVAEVDVSGVVVDALGLKGQQDAVAEGACGVLRRCVVAWGGREEGRGNVTGGSGRRRSCCMRERLLPWLLEHSQSSSVLGGGGG